MIISAPYRRSNLDLGRPLQFGDIVSETTSTIDKSDSGHVWCYLCQQQHGGSTGNLRPLTQSSGVFSMDVLCRMDSPVYLCLEHIPHMDNQFEAFTAEVRQELRAARSVKLSE